MQTRDIAEATVGLLQAQKRKLDESQTQFQAEFEAREARFNADLETIAPLKPKNSTTPQPEGYWLLARKCWAWLYHDE